MLVIDGSGFLPMQRLACSYLPSSNLKNDEIANQRRMIIECIILQTLHDFMENNPEMSLLDSLNKLLSTKLVTNVQTIKHLNGSNILGLCANSNNFEVLFAILMLLQVFGSGKCKNFKEINTSTISNKKKNNNELIRNLTNIYEDLEKKIYSIDRNEIVKLYYELMFCQVDDSGKTCYMTLATKSNIYVFGLISSSLTSKTPSEYLTKAILCVDRIGRNICHLSMHSKTTAIIDIISSTVERIRKEIAEEGESSKNYWFLTGKGLDLDLENNDGITINLLTKFHCITSTSKANVEIESLKMNSDEEGLQFKDIISLSKHLKTKEDKQNRKRIKKELNKRKVIAANVYEYGKKVSDDREISSRVKILTSSYERFINQYAMVILIGTLYVVSAVLGYVLERDILFAVSFLSLFSYHLFVSHMDPGVIEKKKFKPIEDYKQNESDQRLEKIRDKKLCPTCLLPKTEKASMKHCPYCNHCVVGFDHCCPWIGQDVGAKNHRYFILLLVLGVAFDMFFGIKYIAKAVGFLKILSRLNKFQGRFRQRESEAFMEAARMRKAASVGLGKTMYFIFWNFLICMWCIFLLADQLYYIVKDTSLNKTIKKEEEKLERIIGDKKKNKKNKNKNKSKKDTTTNNNNNNNNNNADVSQERTGEWMHG